MALLISIKSNNKVLAELAAINVSESEFNVPYGKGIQHYEVFLNGKPEGIYIEHEFEKGYEPLSLKLVEVFNKLLTVPK